MVCPYLVCDVPVGCHPVRAEDDGVDGLEKGGRENATARPKPKTNTFIFDSDSKCDKRVSIKIRQKKLKIPQIIK